MNEAAPRKLSFAIMESGETAAGRLALETDGAGLFRGFTAELPVDADALVTDYPETFRRVWPQ